MTKDQIMRMAREAGMPDPMVFIGSYERFAASVAADEREACAKVCDGRAGLWPDEGGTPEACASDIRARGQV